MPRTVVFKNDRATVKDDRQLAGAQVSKALAMGMAVAVDFDLRKFFNDLTKRCSAIESFAGIFMLEKGEVVEQNDFFIFGEFGEELDQVFFGCF